MDSRHPNRIYNNFFMTSRTLSNYTLVGLMAFAAAGLVTGLYAGLLRLGFLADLSHPVSPLAHGPLMINGFLGTLIGLERAAALDKKWAYIAPVLLALSTVLILAGSILPAKILLVTGAAFLTAIMIFLYRMQPKPYHLIMALGAASLLAGNLLYLLQFPIYELVGWWAGFPMLTIFGERLELNRIMRPPKKAQLIFTGLAVLWIGSLGLAHLHRYSGWVAASLLLIGMSGWLFKYDVARKTIRAKQWTRYSAASLLTGYGWLVLTGLLTIWKGVPAAGPLYDALLHMIFVGFVFSMIFAHASVIIPSLSGKAVEYSPYFYLPLLLLHVFLLVRVIGDIALLPTLRTAGSHGNVLAILLFFGGIVTQLVRRHLRPLS